jgi:hypothetical protein
MIKATSIMLAVLLIASVVVLPHVYAEETKVTKKAKTEASKTEKVKKTEARGQVAQQYSE